MIKEAINRIIELSPPTQIEYDGRLFVDKSMSILPTLDDNLASCLSVNTLSSIKDYVAERADKEIHRQWGKQQTKRRFIIHIENYNKVSLMKELNQQKQREKLLEASLNNYPKGFLFGQFYDSENFIINLQTNFVQDESTAKLLKLVGNISSGSEIRHTDDGITQQVTAKTGVALVSNVSVPNPVVLRPYRTFVEVEQPASNFVVRVKDLGNGKVGVALFEADGAAWKMETIQSIKTWFIKNIPGNFVGDVIILA